MATNDGLAQALAERVVAFRREDVSELAGTTALKSIADTVGVTLAGSREDATRLLASIHATDGLGGATLLGLPGSASPMDAALVNGTASHALDFDDFAATLGGHHSAPITTALLAASAGRKVTGTEFLTAYVVGSEVSILLATGVHPHHYDKGWHPTATLGVFGTTAAVAKLLGLDVEQTTRALALATSLASGIKANFGTMTKPLHVGLTARSGLMAALLAQRGFTANPGAFEHHQGFLEVFNGPGTYDMSTIMARFANPLKLEEDSVALKQFPCCGSTHAAIAAARRLAAMPGHDAGAIARVDVELPIARLRHTDNPRPVTPLQAKFSAQYVVARSLLDGMVSLIDFEPDRVVEPRVGALLDRLEAVGVEPSADHLGPWGAQVTVTYLDGGAERTETVRIHNMAGRSGSDAMSWDEVREKFVDCATGVLPEEHATMLFDALMDLERVDDIAAIAELGRTDAS